MLWKVHCKDLDRISQMVCILFRKSVFIRNMIKTNTPYFTTLHILIVVHKLDNFCWPTADALQQYI